MNERRVFLFAAAVKIRRAVDQCWYPSLIALTTATIVIAVVGVLIKQAPAQASNTVANRVLGQTDFIYNGINMATVKSLNLPAAVALDRSVTPNRLYVADTANNRNLSWTSGSAFVNGQRANLVIGQPDFQSAVCNSKGVNAQSLCSPSGVAVDSAGNLYVADTANNRVLEYNLPYAHTAVTGVGNNTANMVFGQGSFTSRGCTSPVSAGTLCAPGAVALDSANNLYIADSKNNRVLEFNSPLQGGDTLADMVFGQPGMTSAGCNLGSNSVNPSSLCLPEGVAVDTTGNLYLGDTRNNRVLEYNTPTTSGNTSAQNVFGQADFNSNASNRGGSASANTLSNPQGVVTDNAGNLLVADTGNQRVIEYNTPLAVTSAAGSGDTVGDLVFGQNNQFTSRKCGGPSAASLCGPQGVGIDSGGNLYVADTNNGRMLEYYSAVNGNTTANVVLGKLDAIHQGANIISAQGLYRPFGVAIDTTVSPNHVYVADKLNNRVLGWKDASAFANGSAADLVIGQPDFLSTAPQNGGVSAHSLNNPERVAVDPRGNLYVSDTYADRVLEFNTPYLKTSVPGSGDTIADIVFGQPSFTAVGCNGATSFTTQPPPTANTMCEPVGVAVDSGGNLYVGEAGNNRVLEFDNPIASRSTTPNMVFGQPDFTSDTDYQCNTYSHAYGSPTATTFCSPESVAVDAAGNLYVGDHWFNRVLEYNTPAATRSTMPNMVFGQPNFTSAKGGAGQSGLCQPEGSVVDQAGNLYIADQCNSRVLEYNTPLTTGNTSANLVLGQMGNFNTSSCNLGYGGNPSASDLCNPAGLAMDSAGNLYITDVWNNRVLEFNRPLG